MKIYENLRKFTTMSDNQQNQEKSGKSGEIGKNQEKSGTIRKSGKSGKIRQNQEKSGKIRKHQEKSGNSTARKKGPGGPFLIKQILRFSEDFR